MDLIGYLRVSSTGQIDGYGLESQRSAILAWAQVNGHVITRFISDEGISGTKDAADRPGLSEALDALRPPPEATGLVVARLDRLARSLTVQEAILQTAWKTGAKIFSVDSGEILQDDPDDPMRTAIRQIMGAMAQLDRAMITKRMRDGRRAKSDSGRHAVGEYPFGYMAGGKGREKDAVPNPDEQAVIRRILELRAAGLSLRKIGAELTSAGIRTRYGKAWTPQALKLILDRESK